jgi:tryptophan 2,3-dioxygenase
MAWRGGRSKRDEEMVVPLVDLVSDPEEDAVAGGCPVMAGADDSAVDLLHYWDYLHLDQLLSAQNPKSAEVGDLVHDELLFITVHQTYELWFKQMLVELDSVMAIMAQDRIPERELGTVLSRLQRLNEIQRLLNTQMDVLETLTPLDFLDFRTALMPASGFQSMQFRLIENYFGLRTQDRVKVEGHSFTAALRPEQAERVNRSEKSPSLFDHVERWLERLPHLHTDEFDFFSVYQEVAEAMHATSRAQIVAHPQLDEASRRKQLAAFEKSIQRFDTVFSKESWEREIHRGTRRFSYEAFMAALFITLYRDEPLLHVPFRILTVLIEIDETLTLWRQRHALMAHRMLGRITGTAGNGYTYLEETAHRYTPFKDLFDVSTYLLPRTVLPTLPSSLTTSLDFQSA